jgi:hypothetical protein
MTGDDTRQWSFPDAFDDEFPVGPDDGNRAFFGRDVLRGLISGIDDFIRLEQLRWKQFRSLGPVLLGAAMWINDRELIEKIGELAAASIVVKKQPREARSLRRLRELNERTPGLPVDAFAALSGLAPKVDGEPVVISPHNYDTLEEIMVPTIRTIGYRRLGSQEIPLPPIMHAKLALLGHLWWHDEGALGHVEDVIGFGAKRLWVSSANFTSASRKSLEFGYWTEDRALVEGAEKFLTTALRYSEALDPESDVFEPELVPVAWDDEAFRDYATDMDSDEFDENPF